MQTSLAANFEKSRGFFVKNRDLGISLVVVGIIVMMMIPLPSLLLDILLAAMISMALIILMVSMYIENVLDFSVFPGLLLVITLFRLALNVSSTRLILAEGDAGHVIDAFGKFVTAGNIVVGVIVFVILVIIQFVVITKGSGRIAEVAARFTLDAMPGKQMAIDADLNAGIISEEEAKQRRKDVSREADFYGAMDGASKFVRGDAVAGIIITLINIIGGFIVGMTMLDLSFTESLTKFTQLTIGDGLVTQTPALMISTAAGLMVSRAASKSNLGEDISTQLTQNVKSLYIGSVVMIGMGLVPGMPTFSFLLMGLGVASIAFFTSKHSKKATALESQKIKEKAEKTGEKEEDKIESYLHVDQMELEIGYALIPLVDSSQGGDLLERITMLRRQVATEMGIVVPPIRIRDNIQLKSTGYSVKIKGIEVGKGELMSGCYLAMDPGNVNQKISGVETREPAFGLPALWITESQKERAETLGYTVVELPAVLATHITEIIRSHAYDILTREDVKSLVDNVKKTNSTVVDELIPSLLSYGDVQRVLRNLLSERVPIRDLATILETLADAARVSKQESHLTESCRVSLARTICNRFLMENKLMPVLTLEPNLEQILETSVQSTERGPRLVIRPDLVGGMMGSLSELIETMLANNQQPVLVCSPTIRFPLRKLMEGPFANLAMVAYNEIMTGINLKTVGTVVVHANENISGQ